MRREIRFLSMRSVSQFGMTLMEIMVVLLIISLVMGAIGVGVFSYLKDAKKKTTKLLVNKIAQQLTLEQADSDKSGEELLEELVSEKKISSDKDAWGTKLRVEMKGEDVCVISAGPDKKFDTADDIVNRECAKEE